MRRTKPRLGPPLPIIGFDWANTALLVSWIFDSWAISVLGIQGIGMTRPLSLLLLNGLLSVLVLPGAGQSVSSEIQGTVNDPSGAVIVSAEVTAPIWTPSRWTDGDGHYHVDGLSAGKYELTIERTGFKVKKLGRTQLRLESRKPTPIGAGADMKGSAEILSQSRRGAKTNAFGN
jgi:Carboxypeptidase regulatory-like domain